MLGFIFEQSYYTFDSKRFIYCDIFLHFTSYLQETIKLVVIKNSWLTWWIKEGLKDKMKEGNSKQKRQDAGDKQLNRPRDGRYNPLLFF